MSTEFYPLKNPISSLRVEAAGDHVRISVWDRGALAGTLTVRAADAPAYILMFADERVVTMHRHYAGSGQGFEITEPEPPLDPKQCLVSEKGDVWTVAEVRAQNPPR